MIWLFSLCTLCSKLLTTLILVACLNRISFSSFIQFTSYPGFFPHEVTPLPGQLEAPQLLNRVTKAQQFPVSWFISWKLRDFILICKFIQSCRSVWCRHKLLWFLRSRYLLCGKLSYFIYTKIYTVKLHHSCLWLDQQCIFMGSSLFPIFELKCEKICQYVWNKNIIPWKVLEWFLFTSCDTAKNSLICHAHFFFSFYAFLLMN